jgi:hypothetical protein
VDAIAPEMKAIIYGVLNRKLQLEPVLQAGIAREVTEDLLQRFCIVPWKRKKEKHVEISEDHLRPRVGTLASGHSH